MIESIIRYCVKNWILTVITSLALAVFAYRSLQRTPLDAIPDLSDVQVTLFTGWPGQSPDLMEDQVTYPLVTSLMSAPQVRYVRGQSFFGMSFVDVIFEDGTDLYWARSRVLEYLSAAQERLPEGVTPEMGPDATGVGWVYQYALKDVTGKRSLADLRSLQDWVLSYELKSVPGVAEVASVGGFVKEYQINLDPNRLRAFKLNITQVIDAVRKANLEVGGRVLEVSGTEHLIRGRGYVKTPEDLELVPVAEFRGTPVFLRQLGQVSIGAATRRGMADLDGLGETVGGIVVMRWGGNALEIIHQVKARMVEIQKTLPEGVEVVEVYDRSILIEEAINHLLSKLTEEIILVSLVVMVFLWHFKSALVAVIPLPIAVLFSFIPLGQSGLTANIMSLSGIAIAIGAMVDASIILVENAHKHLEAWEQAGKLRPRLEVIADAMAEMGRPLFFALLVITVSFLPIFALTGQEGRLFTPLALTKTFSMASAAILAITLTPALAVPLLWGKIRPESANPISVGLRKLYHPLCAWALGHKAWMLGITLVGVASVPLVASRLGSEFMPPLEEGTLLYMPTAVPGMSINEGVLVANQIGQMIKSLPEVEHVFTKVGRSQSATDMAPQSMIESIVTFKPQSQWRPGITLKALTAELDQKCQIPGMPNLWWMPIQTRTEMLATGIRSALGIKVLGPNLDVIEEAGSQLETLLAKLPGARSAFAERQRGGHYIDFEVDREKIARFGISMEQVLRPLAAAVGGVQVSTSVEGRERYPITLRYFRDFRSSLPDLENILIPAGKGRHIPISQLAKIVVKTGPPMVRDENGRLASFVMVDIDQEQISLGEFVDQAKAAVNQQVQLPLGVSLVWAGQYEHLERANQTLQTLVPLTLALVLAILLINTGSLTETLIVMLAVPFSLVGAFWLLWGLDYHLSVAVWVGIIALAGLDAETGVVMMLYLRQSHDAWAKAGRIRSLGDFHQAVMEGAVHRIRPKMMTACAILFGLLPIFWSSGAGSQIMKRIAAPMVGGVVTSVLLELLVYPVLFTLWQGRQYYPGTFKEFLFHQSKEEV